MTVASRIPLPDAGQSSRRVDFDAESGPADRVHLLGVPEIHAINAAIAAGRPLLVRGEPGVGKSQLARAAAKELGRAFVHHVVDSHTEARDLLWTFDAVMRLAEAQLAGAIGDTAGGARAALAVDRYLHPGPLWWVFDWAGAEAQRAHVGGAGPAQQDRGDWKKGCVLLIDEIDKAESEVPNGLLEALGAREFTPLGRSAPVRATGIPPLVVITTNEERALPDAFLRRCLVLRLGLSEDKTALIDFLIERGRAHFGAAGAAGADEAVLRRAAEMLFDDRQTATAAQIRPRPGQAEYLDLLRAVLGLEPGKPDAQLALLGTVADYTLRKHAGTDPQG